MALQAIGGGRAPDGFARLHKAFVHHFGMAVAFAWLASSVAAMYAPWTRNLRGLIDPAARPESTLSFLFAIPLLMSVAWLGCAFGGDILRRARMAKSDRTEFGFAALVAFAVFCMAIDRAVAAYLLGQ